jgi:SAM-dependent methyltransferase
MSEVTEYAFEDLFHADEYLYFLEETLAEENTPLQIDFLERVTGMAPPMRVLDLGCGHGRHSNELARRGYKPVGIDLVAGFIHVAEAEAAREGLGSQFVHADLRQFRSEEIFDRALCLFDVLGFFSDEDHELILHNAFSALRPGGKLVLDVRTREWMTRIPPVSVHDKGNGDMMIDRVAFDIESGRLVDKRTFVRDGKVRSVTFSVRLYAYTELRAILRQIGFVVEAVYGGYDGGPLTLAKNRTLVVARKPEK